MRRHKVDDKIVQWVPTSFGVIIPQKSGVVWVNQTSGTSCHQIQIEGVFVPLPDVEGQLRFHECDFSCREKQAANAWNLQQQPEEYKFLLEKEEIYRHVNFYRDETLLHQLAYANYVYDPDSILHEVYTTENNKFNSGNHHISCGPCEECSKHCLKCNPNAFNPNPEDIWKFYKEKTGLDWESVERPDESYPSSQEAFEWVKITKVPMNTRDYEADFRPLLGKVVALVYLNSD